MSPREKPLVFFSESGQTALISKFLFFSFLGVIMHPRDPDQPNPVECGSGSSGWKSNYCLTFQVDDRDFVVEKLCELLSRMSGDRSERSSLSSSGRTFSYNKMELLAEGNYSVGVLSLICTKSRDLYERVRVRK
jgi:hypothetical protein